MTTLHIDDLSIRFGGIVALDGVSFTVEPGEIVGLIGPNGAGKSTVFNCISRLYTPDRGSIRFGGADLLKTPIHRIVNHGIARTFQNLELFRSMTVRETLMVSQHGRTRADVLSTALRLPWARREEQRAHAEIAEIVEFVGLGPWLEAPAGSLPYGWQKRVDLARALATRPKLLLLDEPAAGLNHTELGALGRLISRIRDERGVAVLLVEHHMALVMSISDRVTVLDFGRKIAEGSPAEVQRDPAVIEAYLGEPAPEIPASA